MISESGRAWRGLPTVPLMIASGCGGLDRPQPADPDLARDALRVVLDAWKGGGPPDALAGKQPPVYVRDHEWQVGLSLLEYEVTADEPRGADLRCRVWLTVRDGRGKKYRKTAYYGVGTSPALTVVREDE
jgi:hypothetical protein